MLLRFVLATAVFALAAGPASAGELRLSLANGRATVSAKDVTVREILAEWARVGQTRIVNAEKLVGAPVTLELIDVPEAQALDAILRSASGYVMAPRMPGSPGASVYDRILILASSRPPAVTPSAPAPFARTPQPQVQPVAPDNDAEEIAPQPVAPGANPIAMPGTQSVPGPAVMPANPGGQGQGQAPMTAPRPGMLPAPPNAPSANPYLITNPNGSAPVNGPQPPPPGRPGGGGRN